METSNKLCYWFLFYKDQLLLQKENDTYTIPYGENPPVPVSHTLEVDYRDGLPARTAELDTPVEGNDRYVHMGLRASWIISRERVTRRRVRLINCFIGIAIAVSVRYVVLLPCRLRRSRSNVLLANMRFIRQSQQR